ncbi:hypothetical protein C8J57DRAFT_1723010 [Mycena rebaudengoi]|nr:hypothetical protein C8J57DRAFT_1723010 [Mycena rebaudengoi]
MTPSSSTARAARSSASSATAGAPWVLRAAAQAAHHRAKGLAKCCSPVNALPILWDAHAARSGIDVVDGVLVERTVEVLGAPE